MLKMCGRYKSMRYSKALVLCVCIIAFLLGGCSFIGMNFGKKKSEVNRDSRLIELNYRAAQVLSEKLDNNRVNEDPMLVASFVNLDDIDKTSSLGRLIPQQISSRLTDLGYKPLDIRLRHRDIQVRERKGEIALSRKVEELSLEQSGRTILVGTYSLLNEKIFVTAKILRCRDSATLAAYDYVLPLENKQKNTDEKKEEKEVNVKPAVITDYM